jgi:hypothetical protein
VHHDAPANPIATNDKRALTARAWLIEFTVQRRTDGWPGACQFRNDRGVDRSDGRPCPSADAQVYPPTAAPEATRAERPYPRTFRHVAEPRRRAITLDSVSPLGRIGPSPFPIIMSQQLNKVIKRKRRAAYLKRRKVRLAAAKKK